jgi:hypothetical protein
MWSPADGTTLRAAAFSSVKRPFGFVANQTIEPTEIAGFNQFFTGIDQFYGDIDATISERVCLAVDQKFSSTAFAGAELTARRLKVPQFDFNNNLTDADWREKTAHAYLYKTYRISHDGGLSGWQAAVSLEYALEKFERGEDQPGPEGIVNLLTQRVPLTARLFSGTGLTLGASASYVAQRGILNAGGASDVPKHESAWIADLFVEYRLPRRLGSLSVGAKNLFNRSINILETDPVGPSSTAGRFVEARVRLTL